MNKSLPIHCPSCTSTLAVSALICTECNTEVRGNFDLPILLKLSREELMFIFEFVKASGSLKSMAEQRGVSYPTVRNYLDDIIMKLQ